MQRLPDGSLRYSPSDLVSYLEGDFAAWCDRARSEQAQPANVAFEMKPDVANDELALVAQKGIEHELAFVASLRTKHADLVDLTKKPDATARTIAAMQNGASIIYQGHLEVGSWHGYPDFLVRVNGASRLGDFHYEPWDTKLARTAKPYFIVQLAAYAEMLEAVQGIRPASFCFVLGHGEQQRFRTDEFMHYYRQLKRSFEEFQQTWRVDGMPAPGLDRSWGRWSEFAEEILAASDHLNRVANITRTQIHLLEDDGVDSFSALSHTTREKIASMNASTFDTLKRQARLQAAAVDGYTPPFELRTPDEAEPRRGLALLPPPSPEDVFFDLEGFPYATDGLEYLWGATVRGANGPAFHDWWAHNQQEERRAFEQFIDWAYQRWQRDRSMHIYHYAAYEKTAIRRLAAKFGSREYQVDELLRNEVLVDLFTIVRQGLIVGTPTYSLKHIEHLYMPARVGDVVSASGSVVEYQRWLESGESPDWKASPILSAIREYNRVDCDSTLFLFDWLHAEQSRAGIAYLPLTPGDGPKLATAQTEAEIVAQKLHAIASQESDDERKRMHELLANLVEFHRREEKPKWWRYFERMAMSAEDLFADPDCLAGLVRTDTPPRPEKKSTAWEYRFDPAQETRLHAESKCAIVASTPEERLKLEILSFDAVAGLIELKVGPKKTLPDYLHLMPHEHFDAGDLKKAVLRYASAYANGAVQSQAVDDLLSRSLPRVTGHPGGNLILDGADFQHAAIDLVSHLDHSALCIQGPPGAGKTTIAAAIITDLVRQGKRIGVAANSHKVIMNVLNAVERAMKKSRVDGIILKVGSDEGDAPPASNISYIESKEVAARMADACVVGGTAWCFSRDDLVDKFDYLFIDEAGQVSLANTVAMGQSARNLVLIGDQMQLGQPVQGTHPGESGLSSLDYLLQHHPTIPPELGVFLGTSYRMHPAVCRFISNSFYEGRLQSDARTADNRVMLPSGSRIELEAGVVYVDAETEGCTQCSEEEVELVAQLVGEMLRGTVSIRGEVARAVTLNDILIVAPFNMQVRMLQARLGPAARVGSVDRFQGQEAPIVIVSMCASTLEEAPRGAEFLLSPNRLNVAVSRAQALAVVVGSGKLASARCRTVEEMRLVNGWCGVVAEGRMVPPAN